MNRISNSRVTGHLHLLSYVFKQSCSLGVKVLKMRNNITMQDRLAAAEADVVKCRRT